MAKNDKKEGLIVSILLSPFRFIKFLCFNGTFLFFCVVALAITIPILTHTKPNKYVGVIISVSRWDGSADLVTKSLISHKDTILHVGHRKNEVFEVGQTITVWTGGDLFDGIATTSPQH